jgi:hypothetical protein
MREGRVRIGQRVRGASAVLGTVQMRTAIRNGPTTCKSFFLKVTNPSGIYEKFIIKLQRFVHTSKRSRVH